MRRRPLGQHWQFDRLVSLIRALLLLRLTRGNNEFEIITWAHQVHTRKKAAEMIKKFIYQYVLFLFITLGFRV